MNKISWQSPSNIALVKYWGKHGLQLPSNPSLSFTLQSCHTRSDLEWEQGSGQVDLLFEGWRNEKFLLRVNQFIKNIRPHFPFLEELNLSFDTTNSFPHSAGIASSASAMSSLALCLCSLEELVIGRKLPEPEFFRRASCMARLGSGSAARSVYGGWVLWGSAESVADSADEYAIPLPVAVHECFSRMCDTILIVDESPKAVSSSQGHRLMQSHPFAPRRFMQAKEHIDLMLKALAGGDEESLALITENEALGLHGLMMTANPGYVLLKPGTLQIIDKIRRFRAASGMPAFFTLDAGPNVHLIYPEMISEAVQAFIQDELLLYCSRKQRIDDRIGQGPHKVSH